MPDFKEKLTSTKEGLLLWQQKAAILEMTEMICGAMKRAKVSRRELAKRMGLTKKSCDEMLDGTRCDYREWADAFTVIGCELKIQVAPIDNCDHEWGLENDVKRSQPVLTPLSLTEEKIMEKLLAEPWDEQDWQDLHIAIETAKRKIAARHARRKIEE